MADLMIVGIDDETLKPALEALLLVSVDPVPATELARFVGTTPGECAAALAEIAAQYEAENRGYQLREVAGGWRLYTHPALHELVEGYVLSWDTRKLSQAALETLAVIAYHQPATRDAVRAVRGVNSDGVISSLVDKGLVREVGRTKEQGAAIMYGTTTAFLEKFGLRSIKDLPPLEDFAPDEESRRFIRERLSTRPEMPPEDLEEVDENQLELDLDETSAPELASVGEGQEPQPNESDEAEGLGELPEEEEDSVDLGDDETAFLLDDDDGDDGDALDEASEGGEPEDAAEAMPDGGSSRVSGILDDVFGEDDDDDLW